MAIYIPLFPRQRAILVVEPSSDPASEARIAIYVEAGEPPPSTLDFDRTSRDALAKALTSGKPQDP